MVLLMIFIMTCHLEVNTSSKSVLLQEQEVESTCLHSSFSKYIFGIVINSTWRMADTPFEVLQSRSCNTNTYITQLNFF